MAVILRSDIAGDFVINEQGWVILIPFAYQNGWRPMGTAAPAHYELLHDDVRPQGWHPANYFQGKGQRVSAEDAAAFADALESALPDLPDHDPLAEKSVGRIEAPGFPRILRGVRRRKQGETPRPDRVLQGRRDHDLVGALIGVGWPGEPTCPSARPARIPQFDGESRQGH